MSKVRIQERKDRNKLVLAKVLIPGQRPVRLVTDYSITKGNKAKLEQIKDELFEKLLAEKEGRIAIPNDLEEFGIKAIQNACLETEASQKTIDDYLSKFKRYIVPHFKQYRYEEISPYHIKEWRNELLNNDRSPQTVKRVMHVFKTVMNEMVANGLISSSPFEYVKMPRVQSKKTEPYTVEETKRILAHAQGTLNIFLHIAFFGGLRPGEIVGLQWADIDWKYKTIDVKRSISDGDVTDKNPTKNHDRSVYLPDMVLDLLKELRLKQNSEDPHIVQTRHNKRYDDAQGINQKHFQPLLKELGIQYKGMRATRQTYITYLYNRGVNEEMIKDMVGHSEDSKIMRTHYLTVEKQAARAEMVNNIFQEFSFKKA